MKYRKKPIVIEAVIWSGSNWHQVFDFAGHEIFSTHEDGVNLLKIKTLEGEMTAQPGDWLIRGIKGEYYPCKPDIFEATYEEVEDDLE